MTLWQRTQTSLVPNHQLRCAEESYSATSKLKRERVLYLPGLFTRPRKALSRTTVILSLQAVSHSTVICLDHIRKSLSRCGLLAEGKFVPVIIMAPEAPDQKNMSNPLGHLLIGQFRSHLKCSTTIYRFSKINWKDRKWVFGYVCVCFIEFTVL